MTSRSLTRLAQIFGSSDVSNTSCGDRGCTTSDADAVSELGATGTPKTSAQNRARMSGSSASIRRLIVEMGDMGSLPSVAVP